MQDYLIDLVKNAGADAWEITDVVNEGWEFYFIRHKLDQNRAKEWVQLARETIAAYC